MRYRKILVLLSIIGTYLPILFFHALPSPNRLSITSYLAAQLGYLGAVLLLWQIILGERFISSRILKGDIVWSYKIHRLIGKLSILAVLSHPLLLLYFYSQKYTFIFFGPLESEIDRHIAFGRSAFWVFMVVWLTSALLRSNIGYRPWKYVHYLAHLIFPLVLLHAPDLGTFYLGSQLVRAQWYAMAAVYLVCLCARLARVFMFTQQPYKVIAKQEVAPKIFLYTLEPLAKRTKPKPGQFVYTRTGFLGEEHPFSAIKYDDSTGQISLAIKSFGKYTSALSRLKISSILYLDGPYGVFTGNISPSYSEKSVFIAGGIGITPFIQHILTNSGKNISLYYANRTANVTPFRSILRKNLGQQYVEFFSEENMPGAHHGQISSKEIKDSLGDPDFYQANYYICGPQPMMKAISQSLVESGVNRSKIYTEDFGL